MNLKKAVKELEKQLRRQPGSLVLRIRLAATLHAVGRLPEAVDLYRSVAMAYFAQGRLDQAMAVCHSLLEIAPMHQDTHLLLAELDSHKTRRAQAAGPDEQMDALGAAAAPGWHGQFDGGPLLPGTQPEAMVQQGVPQRETGPVGRRESSPFGWRDTGGLSRRETGPMSWRGETGPYPRSRDTPDPGSGFGSRHQSGVGSAPGSAPGQTPGSALPPHLREGSVASRLPLPVVRTFSGVVPPPPEPRPRGSNDSGAVPMPSRLRRSSDSVPPPATRPPPPPSGRGPNTRVNPRRDDADEDAPTHIADKWHGPFPGEVGRADPDSRTASLPLRGDRSGIRSPSQVRDGFQVAGGPNHSARLPTFRGRLRRPPVPGVDAAAATASAPELEPTQYDDNMELARALGRNYGMGDESALDVPGKLPLLAGLSERAVQAIAAGMVRKRVGSGEMIVRDGEPGDSCFVLAHGEARVLKRDPLLPRSDLVEVSRLGDGDLFGEVAMLSDRRRHASVQAVSDCDLLEIPRAHLVQAGRRFPEVDSFLQQFYRERLIATLVTTASFFRPLDATQRTSLLSHFRFSHVDPGARIVGEGERAGGFFLIVLGAVEITKRVSERRQVLLATLGEGTYFGEMSLLRGEVARASVTATGPAELAVLPAKNFYALVANHPVLWDQVRQEAHRRELEMVQIVTGVTGTV
jgi:CRP-like cAMP-binding protein